MDKKEELVFGDEHKELVFEDEQEVDVESIENDDNVLVDLFRDSSIKDKIINNMFDERAEEIEKKATEIHQIIVLCNELVQECSIGILLGKVDDELYKKYRTRFALLRHESITLRNDYEEMDESQLKTFIIESRGLFDYYVNLTIEAVKTASRKEK